MPLACVTPQRKPLAFVWLHCIALHCTYSTYSKGRYLHDTYAADDRCVRKHKQRTQRTQQRHCTVRVQRRSGGGGGCPEDSRIHALQLSSYPPARYLSACAVLYILFCTLCARSTGSIQSTKAKLFVNLSIVDTYSTSI